jgi:putative transposase
MCFAIFVRKVERFGDGNLTMSGQPSPMSRHTRPHRPGATAVLTIALVDRGSRLLVERVDLLRAAVRRTRADKPFRIDAWIVLADHMQCLWTLPEGVSPDPGGGKTVRGTVLRGARVIPIGSA